ncbi:MAG TPA: glycoside hydrolase [Rhizobiales bacterium]|nr:glycoside hydrolase [Hyphomicrobiales bacterium]
MSRSLSRRGTLSLLGAGVAGLSLPMPTGLARTKKTSGLAGIARQSGLLYGASAGGEIFENPAYRQLYLDETAILTTDVALKFDWIRPQRKIWDFSRADRLLKFTKANALAMRGHTLIWNENAPDWLKTLSRRDIRYEFDRHIDKVTARYAGQFHSWDVVNEPFWPGHGKTGGYRTGPWLEAMGSGYVARAFRRAAAVDPAVKLVLNEAHTERNDEVGKTIRASLLRLVDRLLEEGAPLHAIGLQGHLQPGKPYDDNVFTDFLWQINSRGLAIYITEFDINDETYPANLDQRDQRVALRGYTFLKKILKVPAVQMVVNWQLADPYSWYADLARSGQLRSRREPRPLPFDNAYRRKPLWTAMARAMAGRPRLRGSL